MRRYGLTLLALAVFLVTVVPAWLGLYSGYVQFLMAVVGINIILTASLNLINGYMGEFSVGHAAFMGVGAYVASLLTVWLFGDNAAIGAAGLPGGLSPVVFPLALLAGGVGAALFSLLVAVPSFRTRGDYLAVVTLAVNFIFKSLVENVDAIGGPRGFMGMGGVLRVMGDTLDAPWLLIWTFLAVVLTLWIIRNFTASTLGKGVVAIRDDEIAAELMTVNTRRLKVAAFMLGCGLAGVAGGLHAHLVGFINPSSYFLLQSTLILVMVYLGGIGSLLDLNVAMPMLAAAAHPAHALPAQRPHGRPRTVAGLPPPAPLLRTRQRKDEGGRMKDEFSLLHPSSFLLHPSL